MTRATRLLAVSVGVIAGGIAVWCFWRQGLASWGPIVIGAGVTARLAFQAVGVPADQRRFLVSGGLGTALAILSTPQWVMWKLVALVVLLPPLTWVGSKSASRFVLVLAPLGIGAMGALLGAHALGIRHSVTVPPASPSACTESLGSAQPSSR